MQIPLSAGHHQLASHLKCFVPPPPPPPALDPPMSDLDLHYFLNMIYLGIQSELLTLVLLSLGLSFFENTVDSDQQA